VPDEKLGHQAKRLFPAADKKQLGPKAHLNGPFASTKAKRTTILIESPKASAKKNDPIKDTGTAIIGTSVERTSPKKSKTTKLTKINASRRVFITSSMEASRKRDTS